MKHSLFVAGALTLCLWQVNTYRTEDDARAFIRRLPATAAATATLVPVVSTTPGTRHVGVRFCAPTQEAPPSAPAHMRVQ